MTTSTLKDFFEFVKAIGESKSKQEEDRIITDEVMHLKKIIPQSQSINKKKLKELLIRSIYVEMLGQDASFAYIKAVELCASTNIIQKRVGYLTASLCLSPTHEFRFMLVNQIQRDMKSSNQLESCAALSAITKLITEDMIPAVLGEILKLLSHDMEIVRKKAALALHRMYQMDKSCLTGHLDKIRKLLCDKDPSVMSSCLPIILDMARDDVIIFKDLVPSLVSILKQITEHRLPRDYDYHRIPAPWIQMNILRILSLLGRGDQAASEGMYEVLVDVMKRADTGINVGYAIVYETVKTVTTIYPNPTLLDAAATSISRFIRSDSHNLKYIGIKGLASIVKDHPKYAVDHQMAVIDCLEDDDETLKRKTLDLLFRMTNSVNVEFIVNKLLAFLEAATDDYFRTDLVSQITQCAERYAPSNAWYVQTIVRVFELAGDKVKLAVAMTLTQLIAQGADDEDDVESDTILRVDAVEDFLELITKPKLPEILAQTMAWVLGEYGYLSETHSKEEVMEKLCNLAYENSDNSTRSHVITALMKLVAQNGSCPVKVTKLINYFYESISIDLQQRCLEFKALLLLPDLMVDILPVDASCEDIDMDVTLSFLNGYINQLLANGATPYSPPVNLDDDDDNENDNGKSKGFKITPYEKPSAPPLVASGVMASTLGSSTTNGPTPLGPAVTNPAPILSGPASQGNQLLNSRGTAQVWGRKVEVAPPPPAVPAVSQIVPSNELPTPVVQASSVSSSLYPSTTPPATIRQPSQKELMAQALFSGVGGGITGGSANNSTTRAAARAAKRSSSITTSTNKSNDGLIDSNISISNNILLETPVVVNNTSKNLIESTPVVHNTSNNLMDLLEVDNSINHVASSSNNIPDHAFNNLTSNISTPAKFSNDLTISNAFDGLNISSNQTINTNIYLTDSKPLALSINEFGMKWGQLPNEIKSSIKSNINTLDNLKIHVPGNYQHIESIIQSNEAIFASITNNSSIVLIHIKINTLTTNIDVTVKSVTREICSKEFNSIAHALSSY